MFPLMLISCQNTPKNQTENEKQEQRSSPQIETKAVVIEAKISEVKLDHKYFVVSYNKEHRLANYVQYALTKKNIQGSKFKRTDKFFPDPQLKKLGLVPVVKKDYLKSGFDRGHLAPAEDFSWSREGIDQTFVMTNITPQKGSLNQRAWKYLEARVRRWACGEEKIEVSTGPVLITGLKKLKGSISIPEKFFKAVVDHSPPKKAVCFIYRQEDEQDVYRERAMSVSECEKIIGFKLFPDLLEKERRIFETRFQLNDWTESNCKK